jgi:PAS domain S-box-containing protein
MNSPARVWLTVGPVALAVGGGTLALVLASEHEEQQILTSVFGLLIGWAFVAAGLIARTRRPENRTGVLLLIVGFSFFAGALAESNWSLPFSIGFALGSIFVAALIHVLLAYPSGRLTSRWERAVVVLSYATALLANLVPFLFEDTPNEDCKECPANAFLIVESPATHDVMTVLFETLAVVLVLVVAVTLFRRWRGSSPAARRLLGPVLLVGGGTLLLFGISIALSPISSVVATVIALGAALLFMAVPFVFLWGVLRSRLARSEVGALLADAQETPTLVETQEALRVALRDPTAELVYWLEDPGGYFKVEGQRLRLEDVGHGRAVTEIESEGGPLAAIIHDPALLAEPELLSSVCQALRLRLEKDRTVRALRISEYRSRALLDAIPDTMFRVARDGTVLDIHSHDPENVVMPPEEMIGTSLYEIPRDVIARETMEERKVLVERAFETGEAQTQEYEINMPTGGRRFAETRIVPSGENEFVMIVRDVTEEKRTESRGRALLDAIPDAMFRLSRDGRFLDFHTQRPELLVIPADEILGSSVYDIPPHRLAPEVVRKRMELAERAFETGDVQTHEYEMRTPDGRTMYSEARIVPSGEDEWVMIVRDVTESRLMEARNQALLEALPDAVFRLTREGIYLDFRSPDAERRGVDPQAFIGTSIENALPPDVVSRVMEAAEQAFATGEVQTVEGEMEYDGGTVYAEARIVPSGENEFVMIVRDVTDRIVQQRQIETQNQFLEAMGDATTGLLCNLHLDGRIGRDSVNLPLRELTGYAQYEVDGGYFWEVFVAPEDRADAERVFREVVAGEQPGEQQSRWLTKDGREVIVAWTCRPMPEVTGEAPKLLVSGSDVTERALHQEQLQTERDYMEAVTDATPSLLCRISSEGRLAVDGQNASMQAFTGYTEQDVAGRLFWEAYSAPEDAEAVEQAIAAAAAGNDPGELETQWVTRDGLRKHVAWTCTPLPARETDLWGTTTAPHLLISGTDVTERRRREDEQAALSRVAVAVASERRAEEVFHTVTREVGQLLGATRADMIRFDGQRDEALIVGVWGRDHTDETELGRWMTPVQGGPTRAVWESGETMRFEPDGPVSERLRGRLLSMGITSTVVAPVSLSGRVWGAISVWVNEGRLPLETEERIARFTALVATALANTEAREELVASRARIVEAGDAERRRLERNLHDGAQQRLVSLSLSLRLAQAKLATDAHAADEILSGASVELALALEELRELARGIHPAVLTDRGLGPALESLADRTPIPVEFDRLPEDRLPPPVEAAAFYVVSEALANVAKYADASSVSVSVAQEDGYAVVEVADNGVGGADPTGGSGLRGLSDRVAALEGRLAIVSPPGAGTRIRAEIPCGR